jgi:hypothetical protein
MLAAAPRVPYHEEKETTMIGIRLADRSVFPVFEDERPGKRRVLLSTSRERQSCVEIPIVRSQSALDAEAAPVTIGTVRLEDLAELPRNEQEIELTVGLGSNGTLSVAATDRGSGNIESISINLAQATAEAAYVVPESLTSLPETATVSRRRLWPVIIILLVLIVLFGGALWLAFGGADQFVGSDVPGDAVTIDDEPTEAQPSDPPAPSGSDVTVTPEERETVTPEESTAGPPEASPVSPETPAASPPPVGSIEYRIRRGDTLWDLANSFYGNPWLYPTLAESNRISNPDLIYAEDKLTVPGEPEPTQ